MFLKSIELAGFKSFNERTVIKLDDGIACIVGPNGSGKSNIADAVRWVLGEQSARILRGNKMEDVIFAGTDKLKSLGMAEVVLNIDNADGSLPTEFTEVAVCRRAYRNGDSEYLLNGRQCRLTDIRELFMDSGISNNSLALIGQGRIQQVVDMKADERRLMLEEAAGIVKYRTRKRTAQRKLVDTEQNLARIWDIISELADRLTPLSEQSAKAEEFLRLKEQADTQEINLLLQNLAENKQKLQQTAVALAENNDLSSVAAAAKSAAEGELAEKKLQNDRVDEAISAARQQLFDYKTSREQVRSEGELLAEKIGTAEGHIARLQNELTLLLTRDDGFVAEVNRLSEEKELTAADLTMLQQDIAERETDFAAHKEQLDELIAQQEMARQEIFDNASQLANTRNEIVFLERAQEENEAAAQAMQAEMQEIQEGGRAFEDKIAAAQAEIDTLLNRRDAVKAELGALNTDLDELEQQIITANEAGVAIRLKLNSEESRLKVLSEMADNKSGFYPGVRSILRAAERGTDGIGGVHGVVLDLIESDIKFSQALEAAAGANLQNIVVEDDRAARDCVAYLKREQLGRATFLPLQSLRWRTNSEIDRAEGEKGVIGRCSEVIRCAEAVKPAVKFLFDNILLVDDLDTATRVARQFKQQFRIVTLAGDIISPGGSITGGSKQKNSGDLLQKKNQLVELKKSVEKLQAEGERQRRLLAEKNEQRTALDAKRSSLMQEEREIELLYLGKVKDIGHLRDNRADKDAQLQKLQRDLQENSRQQQRYINRRAELADEVANWDMLSRQANEVLLGLQRRYEEEAQKLESVRGLLEQQRLQAQAKQQEYTTLVNEVQRLTSAKSNLFEEQAQKQQMLADLRQQLAMLTENREQKQQQEQALLLTISEAEEQLELLTNQCQNLKQQIEDLERQTAEHSAKMLIYTQEIHRLEVLQARLQTEEEVESKKLAENFSLAYEEALSYLDESISRADLARSLKDLRRRLAALGNVNIEAIEEYRNVRERYEFLSAQREDLLEARNSLNNVIKEMDSIMSKRFRETFEQVNKNFAHTFNQLFGGGTASLLLLEPDDVLESGVDMMVQPPGKRLINYNLLSGGEKSLIGVALVLAIFQVKPSAFCILDEVDAALDEANVDRFAEYIKVFKEKTQFVVVTHRQGTMEVADRLWGVTMEKNGVSRIVSVKLSDDMQQYIS